MGNITESETETAESKSAETDTSSTKIIDDTPKQCAESNVDETTTSSPKGEQEQIEGSSISSSSPSFHYSEIECFDGFEDDEQEINNSSNANNDDDEGLHLLSSNDTEIDHDDNDDDTTTDYDDYGDDDDDDDDEYDDDEYDEGTIKQTSYDTIFQFDFNGKPNQNPNKSDSNLSRIPYKKMYCYHEFEHYGTLLSNILLNAFMDKKSDNNDDDIQLIQTMSHNICLLIIDFLELYIPKSLIIEHSSYYTLFTMNINMNIDKIRSIIGRLPIRNMIYRQYIPPFIYIGNDALIYCSKYDGKNNINKGMKQEIKKQYESFISYPIKYNMPIYTNNLHKNCNVNNDLLEFWKYITNVQIGIDIQQHPLLMIMPSQTPYLIKETIIDFAFQTMHVPALCILDKNVLILSLLNNINTNNGTGIIIDISNDICTITPIIEFKVYQNKMIISTFHSGMRMNDDINIKINQKKKNLEFNIKCKISESGQKYDELCKSNVLSMNKIDFLLYKNGESLFNAAHSISIKYKKKDYSIYKFNEFVQKTVSDHNRISMANTTKQNVYNGNIKGLHELIIDVIDEFDDEELKRKLMGNIIIYGSDENGICTVHNARNIEKRLFNELQHEFKCNHDNDEEMDINIHCLSENNIHFHYISYLTQYPQFSDHWITKEDYIYSTDIKALCNEKWNITPNINDKFNELTNNKFYQSIFDSLPHKSLSYGPVF